MIIRKTINRSKALCWINDNVLIFYKKRHFCLYDLKNEEIKAISLLKMSFKQTFFSLFSLTRRLFRLYPQSPAYCEKRHLLFFTFCGFLYSLNFIDSTIKKELKLNHSSSRVLSICVCNDGSIFFGEYPTKYDNEPVHIFQMIDDSIWSIVYSFQPNSIRHIHLLKEYKNDLYCFTGDENEQVNIMCFKDKDFSSKPSVLACGNQKYRACVAAFNGDSLFYVTDNPYFENKLVSIDLNNGEIKELLSVEGSVIYGTDDGNHLLFSTCVEKNLLKDLDGKNVCIKIDGENGGIRSKHAIVYCYNFANGEIVKFLELKKDLLSIKLFGLGSFVFPCSFSNNFVAFTSLALKNNERTFVIEKESENR